MVLILFGLLAGLLVAMPPVGPLTVLYFRRLVVQQFAPAVALGAVAAMSDVLYSGVVTFGYDGVIAANPGLQAVLRVLGVALLAGMGIRYAFFPPEVEELGGDDRDSGRRVGKELGRGSLIALLNPSAFVTWTIVLDVSRATLDAGPVAPWQRWAFPLAVGLGAFLWFGGVAVAWRAWVDEPPVRWARRVNRIVGIVLIGTSVWYGWEGVRG